MEFGHGAVLIIAFLTVLGLIATVKVIDKPDFIEAFCRILIWLFVLAISLFFMLGTLALIVKWLGKWLMTES